MSNKKILILSVFFCFALIITIGYISYSSLAIYKNSGTGDAEAVTAAWSVSATSNDTTIDLIAGTQVATYSLTVNNDSYVNVIYSIQLSNLPSNIQVKLDTGSYVTESNNSITFSNVGELQYSGTTQRTHTLTFSTPLSSSEITNQSININVIFAQKIN